MEMLLWMSINNQCPIVYLLSTGINSLCVIFFLFHHHVGFIILNIYRTPTIGLGFGDLD